MSDISGKFSIKVLKKPDVTDLAGEKVMIDFESGKYFMLVGSANDIWDMISDGKTTEEIIEEIMNIYEVDEDICRASVFKFLNELADIGFLSLDEHI